MKKLTEILNEASPSDTGLGYSAAEYKVLESTLKSFGFKEAPVGSSTYKPGIGKIEKMWGIPMRANKWADIFFAIMVDSKTPWRLIEMGYGTESYAKLNDAIKALQKRMRTIKEEEEFDATGETLAILDEISEMTEEIYDTLADLDEIDESASTLISNAYESIDKLYSAVDEKYGIQISDDEYDFSEMKEEFDHSLTEEIDYTRFKQLATLGLVDSGEVSKLILAMKSLESGKSITPAQKDLISGTFLSLIGIITGDTSMIGKLKQGLKSAE